MPAEPFIGEIMYVGGSYAPKGWATCDGQTLGIAQNQALFVLLGTAFGGDGQTTFALPDLRGRAMIGTQANGGLGAKSGSEFYGLQLAEIPAHTHTLSVATNAATTAAPSNNAALGQSSGLGSDGVQFDVNLYSGSLSNAVNVAPGMISSTGTSQGHENRQPFTVLLACIALTGVFPTRP